MHWLELKGAEVLLRFGPEEISARLPLGAPNSNGVLIWTTWNNLKQHSDQRADDYLSGVLAGLVHGDLIRMKVVDEVDGEQEKDG